MFRWIWNDFPYIASVPGFSSADFSYLKILYAVRPFYHIFSPYHKILPRSWKDSWQDLSSCMNLARNQAMPVYWSPIIQRACMAQKGFHGTQDSEICCMGLSHELHWFKPIPASLGLRLHFHYTIYFRKTYGIRNSDIIQVYLRFILTQNLN